MTTYPYAIPRGIAAAATANATLVKGKHNPVDATSGALTMTLPTGVTVGSIVSVEKIDSSGNTVTVSGTIRGSSGTLTLYDQYEVKDFVAETSSSWRPLGDHHTKTTQDLRYANGGADGLAIHRLEIEALNAQRRYAGQCAIDYADCAIQTQDWSSLPATASNTQVSGNKLFAVNATNPATAYIPLTSAITPGEKFHLTAFIDIVSTGGTTYVGLDTLATGNTTNVASQPDAMSVGVTSAGNMSGIVGANLTGLRASPGTLLVNGANTTGRYLVTIDGDEKSISFAIRSTTDNTKRGYWKVDVSAVSSKTFGRIMVYNGDSRALSGHAVGPIALTRASQQPSRTKTVATFTVEGLAHRDFVKTAPSSTDTWRIQIPAGYDPRRPAPLVLVGHQAQNNAYAPVDRTYADPNQLAQAQALGDAGYLVVSPNDGAQAGTPWNDRYGNAASMSNFLDMYAYMRAHFAVGSVAWLGASMGGLTGGNILARRTIPFAAAYLICPSINMAYVEQLAGFGSYVDTAYGVDGTHPWSTQGAGFDPMLRNGYEYRGIPMRFVAVSDDTTAPPSVHVDPFIAKISPYCSEASKFVVATGGHLPAAAFDATDLMTFLNAHIG